jgi:hypothetical protein
MFMHSGQPSAGPSRRHDGAGSGLTDRDWNAPIRLKWQRHCSPKLAKAALLRCATTSAVRLACCQNYAAWWENQPESHLDELAGAVRLLASYDFVDPARIFALTSSEGALHALNYHVHDPAIPFAGMVLTAPPGRTMGELGRAQVVAQLSGLPNGTELIDAYDAGIARFQAGEEVVPDPSLPEGYVAAEPGYPGQPALAVSWIADAPGWRKCLRLF